MCQGVRGKSVNIFWDVFGMCLLAMLEKDARQQNSRGCQAFFINCEREWGLRLGD